jgi:hypothetical protein
MRRAAPLLLLLLAGCSTAPLADLLDFFSPGKLRGDNTPPRGGVCIPQGGPIVAPAVPAPAPVVPAVPVPPAATPSSPFLPAQPTSLIPPPGQGGNEVPVTRPF